MNVLNRLIELLRIQCRSGFSTPRNVGYYEAWETGRSPVYDAEAFNGRQGSWLPNATISQADIEEVRARWQIWREPCLDAAVERFEDAVFSLSPADTVAHAIRTMEAVAVIAQMGRQGDSNKRLLCSRIPALLGGNTATQERWENLLRNLYGRIRSGKAHIDPSSQLEKRLRSLANEQAVSSEELAKEILNAAAQAILVFHDRLSHGETITAILKSLDRR